MKRFNTSEGYNLVDMSDDKWAIQIIGDTAFTGTFKQVIWFSVEKLGFDFYDLEDAVSDMVKGGYDCAHFGISQVFMYSFNFEEKKYG